MHIKEFKPTSWSVNNRTTIYLLVLIIMIFGSVTYNKLPKEKFPDIALPTINVQTVYFGTSPADMENIVTKPIEKQIKAIQGVKKITSNSVQDFSLIIVEFNANEKTDVAKQKVKDAIDKAQKDLPSKLNSGPTASDFSFSDVPIMNVNIAGDISNTKLKKYADDMKDRMEALKEISRIEIVGALDREVQVDCDLYKMAASKVTFQDVESAIGAANNTFTAGGITIGDMKRTVRIVGQFADASPIPDIVIKNASGSPIRLGDIATVTDGFKERESYARLNNKQVVTVNVIKRSGENLIDASDKIRDIVTDMEKNSLPSNVHVNITGDQSSQTRNTLKDLINTIIIGFILVTAILMFFMGTTNALFVGLSVPLSTFVAFMVMPLFGSLLGFSYSLNMIVLFSFLLALGIVVDDAIVVIENTHRIYHDHPEKSIAESAKEAAGEVFVPVLAGTLTTLAPFVPLLFWPGIVGKFMYYLPLTLIITLVASLLVAFIINPVFAASFMKREHGEGGKKKKSSLGFWIWVISITALGLLVLGSGNKFLGHLLIFLAVLIVLNKFVFTPMIKGFQENLLPRFMNAYASVVKWGIKGWHPYLMLFGTLVVVIFSFVLIGITKPKVEFFPSGDPNFVYVYLELPIGTDVAVTDSVTKIIEKRVFEVIGNNNPDVESVISNVAINAGDPTDPASNASASTNKSKVSVAFKELSERKGAKTGTYLDKIREKVKGIPTATITVEKERNGPPTGKPINIEVSGDNIDSLVVLSKKVINYINGQKIAGIEELRSDLQDQNPAINVDIDREKANREGISIGQIGNELRTAIFGYEASKLKQDIEEYPIQVRYSPQYRKSIDQLLNMKLTFREMSSGQIRQVPLSSVVKVSYGNTFGGIKRKGLKRVVSLSSNVLSGYTANEIVAQIKTATASYKMPAGYEIKLTGEQEDQAETSSFLGLAGLLALCFILIIMVTQFNSISKPIIILCEVFFSIAGVLLGFSIFHMTISIVMTGVGIVALAGIVVKNGILLVEFSDELRKRGHKTIPAIVQAGRTRLTPVILTATATMLGLVPLALGMNINFYTLFADGNPQFFTGGESQVFWGPLAWTIIFGLGFATFVTLLVVPAMYILNHKLRIWLIRKGVMSRNHNL